MVGSLELNMIKSVFNFILFLVLKFLEGDFGFEFGIFFGGKCFLVLFLSLIRMANKRSLMMVFSWLKNHGE